MIDNNIKGTDDEMMHGMYSTIEGKALDKAEKMSRQDDLSLDIKKAPTLKIKDEFGTKIVDEIIDNAFKFSKAGQKVHVKSYLDGEEYILVVEDNGRGMSTKQINGINAFMQFERDHYEQQGTGLGLALIKQLCEIYDVKFTSVGEKDKGITATIRFKVK
jgi:K+-sensing histidine kinase KdpD